MCSCSSPQPAGQPRAGPPGRGLESIMRFFGMGYIPTFEGWWPAARRFLRERTLPPRALWALGPERARGGRGGGQAVSGSARARRARGMARADAGRCSAGAPAGGGPAGLGAARGGPGAVAGDGRIEVRSAPCATPVLNPSGECNRQAEGIAAAKQRGAYPGRLRLSAK